MAAIIVPPVQQRALRADLVAAIANTLTALQDKTENTDFLGSLQDIITALDSKVETGDFLLTVQQTIAALDSKVETSDFLSVFQQVIIALDNKLDSNGDLSNITIIPSPNAASGTLARTLNPLFPPLTNPYSPGSFSYYMQGIGSQYGGYTGYYDTKPLATSSLYLPNGSVTFANPFSYGALQTAGCGNFSVNSNRPGFVSGYTDPSQMSAYDEFGAYALGVQADSVPIMATVNGTFTATTFVPSTPITLSNTIRIGIGMFIRTNDSPAAYNGQVTGWTTNASGQVTSITVSNWYQRGGSAGTPTGSSAYVNPQDKIWNVLNTLFLNGVNFTGTTTAGQTAITNVSSTRGLVAGGQQLLQGNGIPAGATVKAVVGTTIYITQPTTASNTISITATTGTSWGKAVGEEMDIENAGVDFLPVFIQDTATTIANSYVLSNITVISQWREGLVLYGTGIPVGAVITDVNISNNTITLNMRATANGSGISIKAVNQLDEGGTGLDIVGVGKLTNTGVLTRGSLTYGFLSHGGVDSAFLMRPDFDAAQPKFGYRTDGKLNGHATIADFAVTDNNVIKWMIKGDGTVIEGVTAPPATSTSTGVTGQKSWDGNYEYRCVATNTWKRVALSSW